MYTTVDGGVTAGGRRRTAVYSHLPARYHPNRNYRYSRCLPVQAVVQEPVAGGQEQPTGLRELSQSAVCSNTLPEGNRFPPSPSVLAHEGVQCMNPSGFHDSTRIHYQGVTQVSRYIFRRNFRAIVTMMRSLLVHNLCGSKMASTNMYSATADMTR